MNNGHSLQLIKDRTKKKKKKKKKKETKEKNSWIAIHNTFFEVNFALVPRWAVYSGMLLK